MCSMIHCVISNYFKSVLRTVKNFGVQKADEVSAPIPMDTTEPVQIEEVESTVTVQAVPSPAPQPEQPITEPGPSSPQVAQPTEPETTEEVPAETEPIPEPPKEPEPEPEPSPDPPKPKISITVKTPKEKQTIEIEEDATIKDIKLIAAEKFSADPDYLCLIFAGKMMEDEDTLSTHNVHEGMTIHLIIKTAPREVEPGLQRPPADISATPFGLGAIGGLVGLQSLGVGSANFMELQNRMQTELLGNPELLRRVLDNPLVNTLMADSDNMKKLIQNNPQMRDLMSRHPEIKTMLNNKELLKSTAELAKNPSMLQELMRTLDGSNPMEGATTSYTTLPNIFTAFQEPGVTETTKKFQESLKRTESSCIFNNPQQSSLLQQMIENPQMVQNMMQAPYTQAMLQALQADPSMASAIINENPLYRNNPQLQQYITSMTPQLVTQLQNPEILNMVSNPHAVNALLQIQEGLDNLKNHAPGLVAGIGMGSFNDFTGANVPSPSAPASQPNTQGESFSRFMAQMVSQMSYSDMRLPPEQRYKMQMEHMKAMGFTDEAANLQTLTAVFGDVNAAVQRLLAQNALKIDQN